MSYGPFATISWCYNFAGAMNKPYTSWICDRISTIAPQLFASWRTAFALGRIHLVDNRLLEFSRGIRTMSFTVLHLSSQIIRTSVTHPICTIDPPWIHDTEKTPSIVENSLGYLYHGDRCLDILLETFI